MKFTIQSSLLSKRLSDFGKLSDVVTSKVTNTFFGDINIEKVEGIIEHYAQLPVSASLEHYDTYEDKHPNAVLFEAMKDYMDENKLCSIHSELYVKWLFEKIYGYAKLAQKERDIWLKSERIAMGIFATALEVRGEKRKPDDLIVEKNDDPLYTETIIWDSMAFLLNIDAATPRRHERDLQRLVAKRTNEYAPQFLPYIIKRLEDISTEVGHTHPASTEPSTASTDPQLSTRPICKEKEVETELAKGNQPTIIEEVRKLEVAKEKQAQPSASPAQKTTTRIFTCEEEEERQTDIVRKFIADNNITVPLDGSMRNPTLAMIHYFYTKWDKKRGMLRRNIIMQDVLDFFIQKCGVVKKKQKSGELTKDKSITEKINALKRQDIELKPTDEIEEIKKTIEKL